MIPKPQHTNSKIVQPDRSPSVIFQLGRIGVLTSVKLHSQPTLCAVKVHNVAADRMLSAKSVARESFQTKYLPQLRLRVGRDLPHRAGEIQSPSISVAWNLHRLMVPP
jgi:hypothetical protein